MPIKPPIFYQNKNKLHLTLNKQQAKTIRSGLVMLLGDDGKYLSPEDQQIVAGLRAVLTNFIIGAEDEPKTNDL